MSYPPLVEFSLETDSVCKSFDTTGILQHNDIGPGTYHPTDIGHLKVAAHMQQYIKLKFGWGMQSTGPMVHSGTYIYNDECCY